jgi:photosystem II stability/assembly factor-like uncharacterized protein
MRTPSLLLGALVASTPLLAQRTPATSAATGTPSATAAPAADTSRLAKLAANLKFRSIGPALTSGRISDVAVDPTNPRTWFVATAVGGVWKSVNAGLSFTPVFDGENAFATGAIIIDPKTPSTVWVGTGENNAQRVAAYGDGIYRTIDGGASWKNMGLRESEHIARIVIDPRDSKVVYVAAQGPLSNKGGDRGVYKTTDGGATWTRVLFVNEWTGANDIQMDPRNPDVLVATMWQRQRRTCCYVGGGPGSGVWRSMDAGKTWTKSQAGFPSDEMGRIGLAMSPAAPGLLYAMADAANAKGGTFRSRDFGASWEKMGSYQSGSLYYNEIFADPNVADRLYAVDVMLQVSNDGGKTWGRVGELFKHVDNHSVWIDPKDSDHLIVGNDGGVYESHDRGKSWRFCANLPLAQFYRVSVDESKPFYRVYGGAQDNFSMGGPSRTRTNNGIRNSDWFITSGGDGFGSVVDPKDPNTVYAQSQFGNLSRFNLATGDRMGIQPEDAADGKGFRWNWDSPLLISPHNNRRIYFAADRVLRSDDRGDSWRTISPDLSRNLDRTKLRVMDRLQGVDAVARNQSTTLYGNATAMHESRLKEGLLAVGTNDGRISVTEDGGATWRTRDSFTGVPDTTLVTKVLLSQHDVNTLYATFNNAQEGDLKPYVLRSTDLGRSWTSITANLPARGSVWVIAEDHVDRNLLFVGTEFGVFFSNDAGARWTQLKGGVPTIQVRDIAIHAGSSDLVLGTFGRGFYILDDYSPLRALTPDVIASPARLFAARTSYLYVESSPLGLPGPTFQGAGYYMAENPPFGAVFTYYLRDALKSKKAVRQEADATAAKAGRDASFPSWEGLRAEDREEEPAIVLEVSDAQGRRVRRLTGPTTAGIHRVAWDLHHQGADAVNGPAYRFDPEFPFSSAPPAPWALPGTYTVRLYSRVDGALKPLSEPVTVTLQDADGAGARQTTRTAATLATDLRTSDLRRAVLGASALIEETQATLVFLKRAIDDTPAADSALIRQVRLVESQLRDAQEALRGDATKSRRAEHAPTGLLGRLNEAVSQGWSGTLEAPTPAQLAQVEIVRSAFGAVMAQINRVIDVDLRALEAAADKAGVPWTRGRRPVVPQ